MARKTQARDLLPSFNLASRFCYFLDLNSPSPSKYGSNKSLDKHKKFLFNQAVNGLRTPIQKSLEITENKAQTDKIQSALEFLNNAALSERNKEIRVINKYIDSIKNNPIIQQILKNPSKQRDDLTNLLQDLQNFSINPTAKETKDFYSKLTLLFNHIRADIENFQTRINQLKSKNRRTSEQIRADFVATRLPSDISTLYKTISGTLQRQEQNSMSTKIIENIFKYVTTKINQNEAFLNRPYEVMAGILIDFEEYLQNYFNRHTDQYSKIDDLDIDALFKTYEQSQTAFLNDLMQNNNELYHMLNTIKTQTGLDYSRDNDWYNYNKKIIERNKRNAKKDPNSAGARHLKGTQQLKNIMNNHYQKVINAGVHWNIEIRTKTGGLKQRNTAGGGIYEAVEELVRRGIKVKGNAGTDVFVVDYGKIKIKYRLDNEIIEKQNSLLEKTLEEVGQTFRGENRLNDETEEALSNIDNKLEEITENFNQILENSAIPEDIFIYHESLKLYTTVEQHERGFFHGREMQILNALDRIYTMNNIAGLNLIDKNLLYNVANNLASGAVGGEVKGEVENYLSIFAGLLMFDDLHQIATDIAKNATLDIQNQTIGNAYNIHLYLVNDLYVPGSLLLTTLCNAMKEGYNKISSDYGAKVTINTKEADEAISTYLSNRGAEQYDQASKDDIWAKYGNLTTSGTKIEIIFLSSFFNFLTDIKEYMG